MVQVSRVFTTGISRNKEIHLKVLIEDDSKIFGSSSIGFLLPNWLVCDSYQGAVGKPYVQDSRRQRQRPAQLRVLRNSPRAMPLSGYELVRPEPTCKESALLCFSIDY